MITWSLNAIVTTFKKIEAFDTHSFLSTLCEDLLLDIDSTTYADEDHFEETTTVEDLKTI